jgi:WD40 repeat protein
VFLYNTGRAVTYEARSGRLLSSRNNAWNVATAGDNRSIVVGSSSVRVLPYLENAGARLVTSGVRIARDGSGHFRVYREDLKEIAILSDPEVKVLGERKLGRGTFSATYNGLWIMRRDEGTNATEIRAVDGGRKPIAVSPTAVNFAAGANGKSFVTFTEADKMLEGYDGATGARRWSVRSAGGVRGMWITPDSSLLLTLVGETKLLVVDPHTGNTITTLDEHNVRLTNVVFPNPNVFFTCGADGRAILWDAKKLAIKQQFKGNAVQRVSGADVSPDGKRVATCNYAGTWQLWDAATGAQLMDFQASSLPLRGIVFTADGKSVVTTGEDNQVKVWTTLTSDPSVKVPVPISFSTGIKR